MSFCGKCGNKLEPGAKFCGKCGLTITDDDKNNPVSSEEEPENTITNDTQDIDDTIIIPNTDTETYAPMPTNKTPLSKGTKIAISIAGAIAIGFGVFWYVGTTITKPSIIVENFDKTIFSNDAKKASSLFCYSDKKLKISEKNIEPLLQYFKDNPSALKDITEDLRKNASNLEVNKNLAALKDKDSKSFTITTDGKKLLFFPNYKIALKPVYIEVGTEIKDVSFSLNNEVIGKSDSDNFKKEYGPFVPGKYTLKSSYVGKNSSLNEETNIDTFTTSNNQIHVEAFGNYNSDLQLFSNYPDTEIYINDKDTGLKVSNNQNLGPLAEGTTIYGIATKNGRTIKSQTYSVTKEIAEIHLSFKEEEEKIQEEQEQQRAQAQQENSYVQQQETVSTTTEAELKNFIDNYTRDFCIAVNNNNFSYVEPYLYTSGSFYKEMKNYIPYTYKNEIKEDILSFKITSFKVNGDNQSATVNTEEVYNVQKKGTSSTKTFACKYTVKYNSSAGRYQIVALDTIVK